MDELYEQTIEKLQSGQRVHLHLSPSVINELIPELGGRNTRKVLCLLSHSLKSHPEFFDKILQCALMNTDNDLYFAYLDCISHQIISYHQREGIKYPEKLKILFEELLTKPNPEIIEWVLRTIEQTGHSYKSLHPQIKKLRPGISRLFNKNSQHIYGLINLLEQKWGLS